LLLIDVPNPVGRPVPAPAYLHADPLIFEPVHKLVHLPARPRRPLHPLAQAGLQIAPVEFVARLDPLELEAPLELPTDFLPALPALPAVDPAAVEVDPVRQNMHVVVVGIPVAIRHPGRPLKAHLLEVGLACLAPLLLIETLGRRQTQRHVEDVLFDPGVFAGKHIPFVRHLPRPAAGQIPADPLGPFFMMDVPGGPHEVGALGDVLNHRRSSSSSSPSARRRPASSPSSSPSTSM